MEIEIFTYLESAGAQLTPAPLNSVIVSGVFSDSTVNYIPMGQSLSLTFNNIAGNLPLSSPETTSNVIALVSQNPIVFPLTFNGALWYNSQWPITATVSTDNTNPTTLTVVINYTNNTGLPQNIPNNFSVAFVVAYQ